MQQHAITGSGRPPVRGAFPAVFLAGACLFTSVAHLAAADDLSRGLPANTQTVLSVRDAPALLALFQNLSQGPAWTNPATRQVITSLFGAAPLDFLRHNFMELTGRKDLPLADLLAGQLVVAIPALPFQPQVSRADRVEPAVLLLAETNLNARQIQSLLGALATSTRSSPQATSFATDPVPFQGVTLHLEHRAANEAGDPRGGWTLFKGVLMLATQRQPLEAMVQRLKTPGDDSLAGSSSFQTALAHVPEPDVFMYLNLQEMATRLQASLKQSFDSPAAGAGERVDIEALFETLGLDTLNSAFLSLHLDPAVPRLDYGLLQTENRGLTRLMALQPVPATLPPFIPAEARIASGTGLDLGQSWTAVNHLLYALSPDLAALMNQQIKALESSTDLHLKADLLDGMGPLVYSIALPPEPPQAGAKNPAAGTRNTTEPSSAAADPSKFYDNILFIQIRNAARMEKTLMALLTHFGLPQDLLETEDVEGVPLHTARDLLPALQQTASTLSYAVTDQWLVVGTATRAAMRHLLTGLKLPEHPLASRPDVRTALATLPKGAVSFNYQDSSVLLALILKTIAAVHATHTAGGDAPSPTVPTLETFGLPRSLGYSVSALYHTGEGFFGTTRLILP